jgi:hypothetical protein
MIRSEASTIFIDQCKEVATWASLFELELRSVPVRTPERVGRSAVETAQPLLVDIAVCSSLNR